MSMGRFADALELIALGGKASAQQINRVSREKEKRQRSVSIVSLSILLFTLILGTSIFAYIYFKGAPTPAAQSVVQSTVIAIKTSTSHPTPTTITTTPPATETPPAVNPEAASASSLTLLGTPIARQSSGFNEIARWGIGGVNVVKWSPDGKTIALGTTNGIYLYDADTKESTLFINTQFNVKVMSFNPAGGDEIIAGSPAGIVQTWNYKSGVALQNFTYSRPISDTITNDTAVTAISYSLDGKHVAIGYQNGAINYFSSDPNNPDMTVENHPTVEDLVISQDRRFIYASNGSNNINVWDIQTATKNKSPLSNQSPINNLSTSPNAKFLLAGGSGNSVYLWDLLTFSQVSQVSSFPNLGGTVTDFDISNDNKYAAIGLSTGEIKVFAMPVEADYSKTHVPLWTFKDFNEKILSVAFSPNEPTIASGNHEEGLKIRNVEKSEKEPFSLNQTMRSINDIYLSSDGAWLASAHVDHVIRIWNVNEAKEAYQFDGYLPKGVPFSPDNRFLTYIYSPGQNKDDVIRVVELQSGNIAAELPDYTQKSFVQFTADSKLLVMGDAYHASIWDIATWEEVDTKGGSTAGCGQYTTHQSKLLAIISDAGIFFTPFDAKMQAMCGTKPRGAALMYYFYAQHKMLFVLGNTNGDLWIWDFNSTDIGIIQSDTPYPESGKIFLAGDQASGWYAYVSNGKINITNIDSSAGTPIDGQADYQYRVALLPSQHLMALGSQYGSIHIWTMP